MLVDWLVDAGLPLGSTDNKKFKKFVHYMRPEMAIPGRYKVTKELVPKLAAKVQRFLDNELQSVQYAHFTFDNWSSRGHENYIALCGHFITRDWILAERIFDFVKYQAGHDHQSIREVVLGLTKQTVQKFGSKNITCLEVPSEESLEEEQEIVTIEDDDSDDAAGTVADPVVGDTELVYTTDNAPAVAKAMATENVTRVPCCGHVISLAVKRVNNQVAAVRKWKKNVVNIVGNFRHSNTNMDLLMAQQKTSGKLHPKKPAQEGDTRWNSTEIMLSVFEELYEAIQSVASKHLIEELQKNLPTNQHQLAEMRSVLQIYGKFLQPFKKLTEQCQSATNPTLPLIAQFILPIVLGGDDSLLKDHDDDSTLITQVKTHMRFQFNKFYSNHKLVALLALAAFCNPLYANQLPRLGVVGLYHQEFEQKLEEMLLKDEGVAMEVEEPGSPQSGNGSQDSLDAMIAAAAPGTSTEVEPSAPRGTLVHKVIQVYKSNAADYRKHAQRDLVSTFDGCGLEAGELKKTIKEKMESSTAHLLKFWKEYEQGGAYGATAIAKVAKYVLAIQGSSASSERVFSRSGYTVNSLRAKMIHENASMLVKTNCNIRAIEQTYGDVLDDFEA